MARRYQRDTTYTPPGAETGRVQANLSLAETLGAFRKTVTGFAVQRQTRLGAQAGAEAGASGTPRLRSNLTAFGRAFNNAAVRNYVISKYTEAEGELARLEAEAGADPEKFRTTADGLRRGAIQGALPEARANLTLLYQRRVAEGLSRIQAKQIEQQKLENRAMLEQGLETVSASISRKLASGDPALLPEAEEEERLYSTMIDGAVASGDIAPHEAIALKAEAAKRVTEQVIVGQFERELESGDPVAFIGRVMDMNDIETLSDEEKQGVIGRLFQRLNRHQALKTEAAALDAAEQKARWAAGEREATVLALRRQLSVDQIARMVADDQLDPAVGRTLESMITSPSKAVDDPQVLFQVRTDLLRYTEEEIANMAGLSHDTRADLILQRRKEAESWRNDQGAREAIRRIDVALGIPEGLDALQKISITPEKANAAANARTYFYDLVEALPEAERKSRYFEMADKAIREVGKSVKRQELVNARQALRRYVESLGKTPEQMNERERAEYEQTLQRRQRQIEQLERELAQ